MTTKLKGTVEDKVRELLDGANPTPKRIEDLMDELEQRRAADAARTASTPALDFTPGEPSRQLVAESALDAAFSVPAELKDLDDLRIPEKVLTAAEVLEKYPDPLSRVPPDADLRRMLEMQSRTLRMMEEKIADLSKKQDPLAVDAAMKNGDIRQRCTATL